MTIEIRIPQVGFSVSEAAVSEWLVADGARVEQGQLFYTLETAKATQDVEAPASGVLRILAATGEDYPVGAVVAEIHT